MTPGSVFASGDLVSVEAAYTYNRFTYVRDTLYDGNRIPGLPSSVVQATARYVHPSGFSLAPTIEVVPGSYYASSENTIENTGWTVLGLRTEYALTRLGTTLFASAENLTDERYSASVQIDSGTRTFYEPSDGRSFYLGLRWRR